MLERMQELIALLSEAAEAYYTKGKEIMSNFKYDKLYDELLELEEKTGIVYPNSVTQRVGYETKSELQKEKHATKMLSLDKTKEPSVLESFIGNHEGVMSWKLDGLTVVLTYKNGELLKAVTRGNGEIGEVITHNAKMFCNLPTKIPFKGDLVLRGEAIITYSEFMRINREMGSTDSLYKNPRNLCSGTIRVLNNIITKKRNVRFIAFNLVSASIDVGDTVESRFEFLQKNGFEVVEYVVFDDYRDVTEAINCFKRKIDTYDYPSDGLVLTYNDYQYGISLGQTNKFPKHSMAFKWQDDCKETTLREIEWSVGRTGVVTPVAVFDTVELEGTEVSRASLHNLSILDDLEIGIGDVVTVYKANMIIPQIADNLTRSNDVYIPEYCPICGEELTIQQDNESRILVCENELCGARQIRRLAHFVSRDAMNIMGLSESTLEKLVDLGVVDSFVDLFNLENCFDTIAYSEGFTPYGTQKLIDSIEKAKEVSVPKFLYALGIPNIGLGVSKVLCNYFNYDLIALVDADYNELVSIEGIGDTIAVSLINYFSDEANFDEADKLTDIVTLIDDRVSLERKFEGMIFVCTGSLYQFSNRNVMKELIENMGGKLTGTVTSKTDYLITNDTGTGTKKNKEADRLGVPIISEAEFIDRFDLSDYVK